MTLPRRPPIGACLAALVLAAAPAAEALGQSRSIGAGPARSVSGGLVGAPGGGFSAGPSRTLTGRGASVSPDGLGGLRVTTQRGSGRFVDTGAGGGRVYFPGGGSTSVIGDGRGNRFVFIPGATRMILSDKTHARPGFSITRKAGED